MGSWSGDLRKLDAAQRRDEREAKRRQRELERRLKEQAKLSALEQARLEVEAHENELEVLLSIHKERSAAVDWRAFASGLLWLGLRLIDSNFPVLGLRPPLCCVYVAPCPAGSIHSLPLTHPAGFVSVARFPSAPFPPGTHGYLR